MALCTLYHTTVGIDRQLGRLLRTLSEVYWWQGHREVVCLEDEWFLPTRKVSGVGTCTQYETGELYELPGMIVFV